MSARVIVSKRDTKTGISYHYCPKNKGGTQVEDRASISMCEGCQFKEQIERLSATYRIHCNFAIKELKGFIPSHAEDGGKEVLKRSAWNILEPKLDGARGPIIIDDTGSVHVFTRNVDRFGKQKEITDNLPHIKKLRFPQYAGTTLDSEAVMQTCGESVGTLGSTMSVVGAKPDAAIATQEQFGYMHLVIFDEACYNGVESIDDIWLKRHELKKAIVEGIRKSSDQAAKYIHLMPSFFTQSEQERKDLYDVFVSKGVTIDGVQFPTEGVVLKNPNMKYFDSKAILKCKEFVSLDVIVTGWEPGNVGGKWEHSIGALLFSVVNAKGDLVEIGKVIPGDDAKRDEMYQLMKDKTPDEITNCLRIVLEIEGQNWTKDYRIRHPRIVRYRPDRSDPNKVDFSKVLRK